MSELCSISSVKKNPAVLATGGLKIVLKNNKPAFLAVPYDETLEESIEDLLEESALLKNKPLLKSLDVARQGKKYSSTAARKKLGL